MKQKVAPILISSIFLFLALKAFNYLLWNWSEEGETLVVTTQTLVLGVAALFGLGMCVGLLWNLFREKPTAEDVKIVGGGVFGLTFLSGICLGGFCLPAAALSSVFSLVYLIPTLLGLALSSVFSRVRSS